jgi:hypothetical protein
LRGAGGDLCSKQEERFRGSDRSLNRYCRRLVAGRVRWCVASGGHSSREQQEKSDLESGEITLSSSNCH